MLFIHGHQWRDIVNVNAMSSYSSSSESSGAGVLIRPIQVSDQARRELRESLEDGEMVGPFGHLVTVFFVFFCLDFCVGCGGKFLEASMRWERRRTDNWYLVSLSHFLIQIDALRCHARQAPKAQRERGSGRLGQNAPNVTLYWNNFHQLSMLCQAVSELTLMNHDEPSIFRHQSRFRHPLFQEHGLVVERRNGYVRLTLVRLKHTVLESGNPRALEQI